MTARVCALLLLAAPEPPKAPKTGSCDLSCDRAISDCTTWCKKKPGCAAKCKKVRPDCLKACRAPGKGTHDGPSVSNLPPKECLARCDATAKGCPRMCKRLKDTDAPKCRESCRLMEKNCPAFCNVPGAKWSK